MRCPFAVDAPVGYGPGTFTGGPYKVVWHKTQGSTYRGAMSVYLNHRVAPHFTVDENGVIHQHFDTSGSAYALVNLDGGVQTNRDSAVQIEVVGFVGQTMANVQLSACVKLGGWLGQVHSIPPVYPLGRPRGAGDSRDQHTWDTVSGHYGHSNVPENNHTDPAWTDDEWAMLSSFPTPLPSTPTPPPASNVNVTFYPKDKMACYHIHTDGIDANGFGDTVCDGRGPNYPAIPAGTIISVRVNSGGHADPRGPRSDGDQSVDNHAQIQWVGPPNTPGFDARIFTTTP